jgi:2-oxoglutarate dehydrogenase E1 component
MDGTPVRISGQDSKRGTFSHRHAVVYDSETRERYTNLLNLSEDQAQFCVHNSLLSEAAVLGFDYGYSLDYPQMLCIWEAQFGDFVNGAQVIIDQFLTSSESKWGRLSGLVMLLPHGYEGQGPEHSSARLERFLQACAENNIQVCNLTTPAQLFHVLRRQMKREFKKPLIIMAPKSLLRHKECVSKVADFTENEFWSILDDSSITKKKTKRIIFCSGKVYYDLLAYRRENKIKDSALVRMEQFYPMNTELLKKIVDKYPDDAELVWCQEEPKNMGGYTFVLPRLLAVLDRLPRYAGRRSAASPAVGSLAKHKREQQRLVQDAFGVND